MIIYIIQVSSVFYELTESFHKVGDI